MPEVNVKGTQIHFLEKKGASSFRVLFIHGSGGNAFGWEKVMDGLAAFHTLAVDLPGHGAIERGREKGASLSIPNS